MEGEAILSCRSQYQFHLGHYISNIPYFLTSAGNPTKPSALVTQPRHHSGYKVVMFFIIHTSNGRGTIPNILYFLIASAGNPTKPSATITTRTKAMLQHLLVLYNTLH
jgi:hypothetical protein